MSKDQLSEVLSEFARTMVTDFPIQAILDHLVERIVEIMPITAAGVTLISPGVEPRYIAASNDAALQYEKLQTELGEGPCLAAYDTGKRFRCPTCGTKTGSRCSSPGRRGRPGRGVHLPAPSWCQPIGALDLYRDTPGELDADAMAAAQTLADVATAYLVNAQARADLLDASDRSREAPSTTP